MAVTSMSRSSIGDFVKANVMSGAGAKSVEVNYLVIAGGAGGGLGTSSTNQQGAGGGGAGGYRCSVSGEDTGGGLSAERPLSLVPGTYAVTVGAGGANATGAANNGGQGTDSVFDIIRSYGGGKGAGNAKQGFTGGSASGSGATLTSASLTALDSQGFRGGAGGNNAGGGGGGAGGLGGTGTNSAGGSIGGVGVSSSITGSSVGRGGGGGGGAANTAGTASDGGGAGRTYAVAGSAGTVNTGGGGGGGPAPGFPSYAGGSGVVILSIPTGVSVSFSVGVTETNAVVGGNTVYTITGAGPTDTVTIG